MLSSEPSSCPVCHCSPKQKCVLECYGLCVFRRVAGLQPLGRAGSRGDSSRQQQAAGPWLPSALPLPGTSCVCGRKYPPDLNDPPILLPRIRCFCAPCTMTIITLSVVPSSQLILLVNVLLNLSFLMSN